MMKLLSLSKYSSFSIKNVKSENMRALLFGRSEKTKIT